MADQKRSTAGGSQPIIRHPLFPAIVALWFGALFALASLAIGPSLVERVVMATGIDRVIPMAAPPLGMTARILIALTMTSTGAVIGALAARRLAREADESASPANQAERPAAPVRIKPAPAAESPAPEQPRIRRRALTAAPLPIAEYDIPAGNPQDDNPILKVADFDLDGFETAPEPASQTPAPEPGPAFAPPPPAAAHDDTPESLADFDGAADFTAEIAAEPICEMPAGPAPTAAFAAPSRFVPDAFTPDEAPFAPAVAATAMPAPEDPAEPAPIGRKAATRIATASLDSLSPLELLERLALAMAQRRERMARAAEAAAAAEAVTAQAAALAEIPQPATEAEAEAEVETIADRPEPARLELRPFDMPYIPAALRPVAFDEDEGDSSDDALPGYIPPRHIGLTPAGIGSFDLAQDDSGEEDGGDDGSALTDGYSSLLDLSRPLVHRQPVIQEEPGTNVFSAAPPHMAVAPPAATGTSRAFDPPAAEDTEQALREALARLQRISGAA